MQSNGGFWPGLIGPYGGTKESEFWRPVKMTIACVVIFIVMLLVLIGIVLLAGDFTGPMLLIPAVLLAIAKQPVGKERTPQQRAAITVLLWFAIAITLFTIYIGGVPIRYSKDGPNLVINWQTREVSEWAIPGTRLTVEPNGELWLLTDEYSIGLGPTEAIGDVVLVAQTPQGNGWTLPLWMESGRWLLVLSGVGAECLGAILLARLVTEILFPALPNSVRAKPGLLARIFPFMRIKNVEYSEEQSDELGSVEPGGGDEAPWM